MACSGQNGRNNGDSPDDSNAGDISGFQFSLDDFFDGRPWRPPSGVAQQSPRRQLVYFMSVLGQIYSTLILKKSMLSSIFYVYPNKQPGTRFLLEYKPPFCSLQVKFLIKLKS